jgi:hypothetical protein
MPDTRSQAAPWASRRLRNALVVCCPRRRNRGQLVTVRCCVTPANGATHPKDARRKAACFPVSPSCPSYQGPLPWVKYGSSISSITPKAGDLNQRGQRSTSPLLPGRLATRGGVKGMIDPFVMRGRFGNIMRGEDNATLGILK